jgi:hypothetical protein
MIPHIDAMETIDELRLTTDNKVYEIDKNEEIRMKVKQPSNKPKVQRGLPSLEIDFMPEKHSWSQEVK